MSGQRQRARRQAMAVGLAATVIVLIVARLGGLEWIELKTLDLRFRYASSIPEDARLVCIDIDDDSVQTIGRWPWPRDIQAGLISILHEAGLETLLYDIELTEPEPLRDVVPRHADILVDPTNLPDQAAVRALPDHELRLAIAKLRRVYLAFHHEDVLRKGVESGTLRVQVRRWLDAEPDRWQAPPHALFGQMFEQVVDRDEQRREELVVALRDVLSLAATLEDPILPTQEVAAIAAPVPALSPVYFPHARAAKRCGFVVFEPDVDGVMRRVRLLVRYEQRVLPQLAFAVAFDELGLTPDDVTAAPGRLTLRLPGKGESLTVQLDDQGRALVPWVPKRDWTEQFGKHVPTDAVWQIYDRRLAIAFNDEQLLGWLGALLDAGHAEQWRQYHADLKRNLELESELRVARYADDEESARQIGDWLAQYRALRTADEPALREWLAGEIDRLAGPALPAAEQPTHLLTLRRMARTFAAGDAYRHEIDETLAWLRERVAGKIGLLGYTATALADTTPIPTNKRAPGVVAHANLLNGLLTGRLVYWAPIWLNMLMALAMGAVGTAMSIRWGPRTAAIVALLAVAYVAVAGGLTFYAWSYWIALTPPIAALLLSYVAVVVHRYLFLERESRQITRALSQYTSATLARKMAEDAELCQRAEEREVTAMFTDLADFTAISERIGAERTQRVLNVSLGCFSDVMIRHEGMVNKFIGDGIFAFWNPVIYPQDDHARRACATALDLQTALSELIEEQLHSDGDEVFQELVLRIGVATGNAVVGPCGSEQKYDYTCIGDSVNVASRLESANKFYGTRILVSGTAREQAGDGFEYRWLGGVQVKGKTQAVQIYELLGRADCVAKEKLIHAERFAHAVTAFQQRRWTAALEAFEQARAASPSESAAQKYIAAIERFTADPPPDDWNGALELTEK